jgi:protein sidekick
MLNTANSHRVSIQVDGTLEIQAVRAADVGEYTCAVISEGGNETRSARLSVIELPFPPLNVHAVRLESVSQRAVNVTWTPSFDGHSPILKYVVQRCEVSGLGKAHLHTSATLFMKILQCWL